MARVAKFVRADGTYPHREHRSKKSRDEKHHKHRAKRIRERQSEERFNRRVIQSIKTQYEDL